MNEEENNETKFEKFKKHLKENWKFYAIGGAGIIIGAAGSAIFITKKYGMTEEEMVARVMEDISIFIKGNNNYVDNTVNNNLIQMTHSKYGPKIGRPGVPIWDTTTGHKYDSMTLAAEDIGATVHAVRNQLHGLKDNVNGHKFKFAYVPELNQESA